MADTTDAEMADTLAILCDFAEEHGWPAPGLETVRAHAELLHQKSLEKKLWDFFIRDVYSHEDSLVEAERWASRRYREGSLSAGEFFTWIQYTEQLRNEHRDAAERTRAEGEGPSLDIPVIDFPSWTPEQTAEYERLWARIREEAMRAREDGLPYAAHAVFVCPHCGYVQARIYPNPWVNRCIGCEWDMGPPSHRVTR